jgi:hypothetical protein
MTRFIVSFVAFPFSKFTVVLPLDRHQAPGTRERRNGLDIRIS